MTPPREATRDPLAEFDLETLARGAARLRPERMAMSDSGGDALTFAALDAAADAMAARFGELGLVAGETLLIAGGAQAVACVALLAALRAGLNAALAPAHEGVASLTAFAANVGAHALVAPTIYDGLAPVETMFEVAARAPNVRLVGGLGPIAYDGAVDVALAALATPPASAFSPAFSIGRIATFAEGGGVAFHRPRALVAAALDIAARARVGAGAPILTCLAPVSFAGLVAGPFLSLLVGTSLRFCGPFETAVFLDALETSGPAHVVVPGGLASLLAEGGLVRADYMASLMLLDRTTEARAALAPMGDIDTVTLVDLHAFGEQAVIAEPRGPDARPLPPAREPHMIHVDAASLVAVQRRGGAGPLAFDGEAVSAG